MASTAARSTVINLRADVARRALIDRAAEAVGKNRSEFMIDAATREATMVLLDRRFFQLDSRAFKQFAAALDAPPDRQSTASQAPREEGSLGAVNAPSVSAPEHLTAQHDVSAFDSGVPELDTWLKRRPFHNGAAGASRTYVVSAERRVVGYYALATGAVAQQQATGKVRRNMPDPIPVMVLGRLAVDLACQGRGLGSALLRDGLLRTVNAASFAGIRAVLLHAISDDGRRFYERAGFSATPVGPMTMMITLADVEKALGKR